MGKKLNRRSFVVGCGLLTFSSVGIFFTACGGSDNGGGDGKQNKPKDDSKDNVKDNNKVMIEKKDKTITISQNDLDTLKSKAYLEVSSESLLVFYYDEKFYGYSNICPHEKGTLKIEDKETIRCTKHTVQTYDKNGATNRAKTNKSLQLMTLNIKIAQ